MTNKPFFSIIIPTLNEETNLKTLLNSIKNQTLKNFEVIVADSLSKDNTKQVANSFKKHLPINFLQKKLSNVSAARNFGASKANGEFLIFFDADVEIAPDFLEKIKEKIIKYNLDATTVWNRAKRKTLTGWLILTLLNLSMTVFQKIKPAANGPCIIVKKIFFEKVKGFDEDVIFGEDFQLMQKLARLKINFKVFPTPILYVSTRRFEKEGLFLSLYKSIKALIYQRFFGPIKKPIFDYKMGGEYFKDKN